MTLNLKNLEEGLPPHLRSALIGLKEESLAALRTYTEYMGIRADQIGRIVFDEGFGDVSSKCKWSSEIAAEFDCIVEFQHNDTPAVCYPTTARAAYASWSMGK